MNGINLSNVPHVKNEYGSFPSISKDMTKVSKDSVDLDSFVRVPTSYTYTEMDAVVRGYLEGDSSIHTSPMDDCINQFFDGTMSESELQSEYENMLKKELFGSMEQPTGPLTDLQKETAENFYSVFREKILTAAVERNRAEGEQYITGNWNPQRNWSYYNSDYYYESESAISAITTGAQAVAKEYGTSFQVPDYLAQGATHRYNFNTALGGNPFVVSDAQHTIIDPDAVPPEHMKWFYESGGDANRATIRMNSLTTTDQYGNKTVIDYTNPQFDPTDPTKAQTWVSYTDENGVEHRLSTQFRFHFNKEDLHTVSDLLLGSENNTDENGTWRSFLSNLQVYPKGYFERFPTSSRSMDFKI